MKTVAVRISGLSPLLMHKFPEVPIEAFDKKPKEEQAELSVYRDAHGKLSIPCVCMQRALVSAATYSKGKGRASLQKQAAACLLVQPVNLSLETDEYAIDARPVVIPATKGRVMRYRPRIDEWSVDFDVTYDETLITPVQMREIVDNAGKRVGVLDFRPERKGPFGRFIVTRWADE